MSVTHKLSPVSFKQVTIDDSFWAPRIAINQSVTIPAEYQMCETTGRIAAFDLRWSPGDPNCPHIFWDSDVAKWIEAASYSLSTHPDSDLDARLDEVISRIAWAQQPDGYLNTHFTQVEPDKRWTNLRDQHELYCAGHLIEAGLAHYEATGKHSLLDVVCRYADTIDTTFGRGPRQKPGYCGHEEIELALVKLHHVTREARYLALAQYFVDERGRQPYYFDAEARARGDDPAQFWAHTYSYMQAHMPVREQTEVTGHAVRAMYLYCAMADLANETGDAELLAACERLWGDLCLRRMYVTGGIGPSSANEGFTTPYDLPDESAYAETCAAVGLVFWNHRMLQFEGHGKYADVMERALYNGTISGVSLDGRGFFYVNPLASRGGHHRKGWFDCACCPPNIARLIASVGGYVYSVGEHDAWVHLYAQGVGNLQVGSSALTLRQVTRYPWDGAVHISMGLAERATFALHLRIPGWCQEYQLAVNGTAIADCRLPSDGYVQLEREWTPDDLVELNLDMPVQYVQANPDVHQMLGKVALQSGPLMYCLEGVDHSDAALDRIVLRGDIPASEAFRTEWQPDLLGGVNILRGMGTLMDEPAWDGLYRFRTASQRSIALTAIPYCTWDNRAPGAMRVWLRTS